MKYASASSIAESSADCVVPSAFFILPSRFSLEILARISASRSCLRWSSDVPGAAVLRVVVTRDTAVVTRRRLGVDRKALLLRTQRRSAMHTAKKLAPFVIVVVVVVSV